MRSLFAAMLVCFASAVSAGNLITGATISEIASSNDGHSDNFYLKFSSGDGFCATNGSFAVFPRDMAPTDDAFNRMFSIALTAYTLGKPVRVYSYGFDDDCRKASMIEIKN